MRAGAGEGSGMTWSAGMANSPMDDAESVSRNVGEPTCRAKRVPTLLTNDLKPKMKQKTTS
jgi:hypothetical protein